MAKRIKAKKLVAGTWYYAGWGKEHYYIKRITNRNSVIEVIWESDLFDYKEYKTHFQIDDILEDTYLAPAYNFKQQLKEWLRT